MKLKHTPPKPIGAAEVLLVIALIMLLAYCIATAKASNDVAYHHARSAVAIAYELTKNAPDSIDCPSCGGRGEVGDGRTVIKCEDCDGTGKKTTQTVSSRPDNPLCMCKNCDCGENCRCGQVIAPPDEPKELVVEWSEAEPVAAAANLPRVLFLTSDACPPCRRVKAESSDLIGDASAAIQLLDVEKQPNYDSEFGIRRAPSIPAFVVLGSDGREVSRMTGYQSRATLEWLLKRHEITPSATQSESQASAAIYGKPSAAATLAALAEHLARRENAAAVPVGGLFDREIVAPAIVPALLQQLIAGKPVELEDAGLRVAWVGDTRSILLEDAGRVVLKPPAVVTLSKWGLSVDTSLAGVTIAEDGATVRFDLTGPDFTVRFIE